VDELVEPELLGRQALELFVVSDFMGRHHAVGAQGSQLAVQLDGLHRVGQPVFLKVVPGFHLGRFLLVGVLVLNGVWLLLVALGLAVEEDGLGVAREGEGVELVGTGAVERVEGWQFLKLEIVLAG
jgi:hypothetical protein